MKILIDARIYGPEHAGNGRYTMNLVENLAKIDKVNKYVILLRKDKLGINLPKSWQKVKADFRHYSFSEQLYLPFLISKYKPDIVHFPHFNVPLFYFGRFIVTIHDLIMHKFIGGEATTRPFPIYQIWRLGYYISFAKAVMGSVRIIVPSSVIKNELVNCYKIKNEKVEVIYE
ncbi:MAG: glycosyltransferase [Patescibacteria group bacterium]